MHDGACLGEGHRGSTAVHGACTAVCAGHVKVRRAASARRGRSRPPARRTDVGGRGEAEDVGRVLVHHLHVLLCSRAKHSQKGRRQAELNGQHDGTPPGRFPRPDLACAPATAEVPFPGTRPACWRARAARIHTCAPTPTHPHPRPSCCVLHRANRKAPAPLTRQPLQRLDPRLYQSGAVGIVPELVDESLHKGGTTGQRAMHVILHALADRASRLALQRALATHARVAAAGDGRPATGHDCPASPCPIRPVMSQACVALVVRPKAPLHCLTMHQNSVHLHVRLLHRLRLGRRLCILLSLPHRFLKRVIVALQTRQHTAGSATATCSQSGAQGRAGGRAARWLYRACRRRSRAQRGRTR